MKPTSVTKKIGLLILTITLLTTSFYPRPAQAQFDPFSLPNFITNLVTQITEVGEKVTTGKSFWKDFVLDKVAFTIAQNLSDRMVRSVVEWANTGFKSYDLEGNERTSPFFVTNYQELFVGIAGEEILGVIDIIENSDNPFASQTAQNLIRDFQNSSVERFNYTLEDSLGIDRHDRFVAGEFSAGGWDGYFSLLEEGNNPISFWTASQEEQLRRVAEATAEKQLEINAGQGIQGQRECSDKRERSDGTEYCARYAITTPGSIIEEKLGEALTTPERNAGQIDEWGELLINSLVKLTDGLTVSGVSQLQTAITTNINSLFAPDVVDISQGNTVTGGVEPGGQFNVGESLVEVVDIETTLQGTPDNPDTPEDDSSPGMLALLNAEIADLQQITSILRAAPPRMHELDVCLPGPDTGWEKRLNNRFDAAISRLRRIVSKDNPDESEEIFYEQLIAGQAQLGQNITLEVINPEETIPSAFEIRTLLLQSNKNLANLNSVIDELTEKSTLLAELSQIWTQWESGTLTPEEQSELLKKFKVLSSSFTFGDETNEVSTRLETVQRQYEQLGEYLTLCKFERANLYDTQTSGSLWLEYGTPKPTPVFDPFIIYAISAYGVEPPTDNLFINNAKEAAAYLNEEIDPLEPELRQYCYDFIDPLGYEPIDADDDGEIDQLTPEEAVQIEPMRLLTDGQSTKYRGIACSQFYHSGIADYYPEVSAGLF